LKIALDTLGASHAVTEASSLDRGPRGGLVARCAARASERRETLVGLVPDPLCEARITEVRRRLDDLTSELTRGPTLAAPPALRTWLRGQGTRFLPADEAVLAVLAPPGYGKSTLLDVLELDLLAETSWRTYHQAAPG